MAGGVDTRKTPDFRVLHLNTPAELRHEVDRIVAAERAGRLRRSGNWTVGQTLGHLATWIDYAYDGYPPNLNPPWFIKAYLKLLKKRFLRGPLPRGLKIPKIAGGTMGIEPQELDRGLDRFRAAWDRLEKAPPAGPNIIFGPMTHEEWVAQHLRHAELHLGYLQL